MIAYEHLGIRPYIPTKEEVEKGFDELYDKTEIAFQEMNKARRESWKRTIDTKLD